MKVSLLIDPTIAHQISEIKSELYKKGYRIDGKTEIGVPHIKLAEADNPPIENLEEIKSKIDTIFEKYKNRLIENYKLVNMSRDFSNWVALQIDENWLRDLSIEIENYLESLNINRTVEYKSKIYNLLKLDNPDTAISPNECIADHMNLINKCKKEFSAEAFDRFKFLTDIKSISVDKILFEE